MGHLVVSIFRRRYRISQLVKILFSYTKFLGSSVIEEVDGEWSVSSSLLAFNFFISLFSSLCIYLEFSKNVLQDDSYLFESLLLFNYLLLFASRIVILFSQIINLEHIRHLMRSFKSLDEIFLSIDSQQLVLDGPPMFCFIVNNLLIIFSACLDFFRIRNDFISLVEMLHSFYLPFVMNVDIFNICILVHSVQVNLSYLNSCLETLKLKDSKLKKIPDTSVEYCCIAYNEICLQVDRLNSVYGLQLLLVFINIFILLTYGLFHLIFLKFSGQLGSNIGQALSLLMCIMFTIFVTFSITSACDRTVTKAKEFNSLLYQLMINDKTSVVSKNKKLRLHASMKREIMFTAHGFFSIDYTLVHSIAAAATTYLVMLIQFSQPTTSEG